MAKKILLLTNKERGQANVFLATAQALIEQDPTVEIHFATFPGLENAISSVSNIVQRSHPAAKAIVIHRVEGISYFERTVKHMETAGMRQKSGLPASLTKPLSFWNTLEAIKDAVPVFLPYNSEDISAVVLSIIDITHKVRPDLVVVDGFMSPALTAVYHLQIPFTCLSPNAIKDFAGKFQPRLSAIWKFPALFSGYSFPVPWYRIPTNIFIFCYMIYQFHVDGRRKQAEQYLQREHQIKLRNPTDLLMDLPPDVKILVSSLPETDLPVVVPPHVIPCGPIILKSDPMALQSSELNPWLDQRPTIYVNLGSQYMWDENGIREFARALRIIFENTKQEIQCLWKLKPYQEDWSLESDPQAHCALEEYLEQDRIRIVSWVDLDPLSLLETGQVVCSVHHGGANSYNEALWSAVPQVVLPVWFDCYDYAQRVQLLGIGRIGSPTKKPQWLAEELAAEILVVIQGRGAQVMKQTCIRLAETCRKHDHGAVNAAKAILQQISANKGGSSHHTAYEEASNSPGLQEKQMEI
ncbi:hypothetical protein QQS21_010008 [Conoideocrella luteorostrata]|uniref:Erythromycin biosynthesis protein CIII-like C-terminal domain-containing protein n=1 Tax=Conoideocrella luteorostrata TaxID=1105319 RepID=A0AAJ0FV44_9HYPO|nr:hypothetical protein QQS21_010008 [Conoideocrella luteorostrata]